MTNSQNGLRIINHIPNDRLLLESDYPFILKEDRNPYEICDISKTVIKLARIENLEYEEILYILNNNFKQILK